VVWVCGWECHRHKCNYQRRDGADARVEVSLFATRDWDDQCIPLDDPHQAAVDQRLGLGGLRVRQIEGDI